MNPSTYWLFDTDDEMLPKLNDLEEDEHAELIFDPITIHEPAWKIIDLHDDHQKHLDAHREAIKSDQTKAWGSAIKASEKGSIKHMKKDKSDCEYHKWTHVGCSPFSGEQWYNCEHCGISKEDYEKSIKYKD